MPHLVADLTSTPLARRAVETSARIAAETQARRAAETPAETSQKSMLLARGLTYMGLGKYAQRFEKLGYYDIDSLKSLDEDRLTTVAERTKMAPQDRLKFIKAMIAKSSPRPPATASGEPEPQPTLLRARSQQRQQEEQGQNSSRTQAAEPAPRGGPREPELAVAPTTTSTSSLAVVPTNSTDSLRDLGLTLNEAAWSALGASLEAGHRARVASWPHRKRALRASRDAGLRVLDAAQWAVEASRAPRERAAQASWDAGARALQTSLDAGQWALESSRAHRERALQAAWNALVWSLEALLEASQQAYGQALEAAQHASQHAQHWAATRGRELALEAARRGGVVAQEAAQRGGELAQAAVQRGSVLAQIHARKAKEAVLLHSGYANEGLHSLLKNLGRCLARLFEADSDSEESDGSNATRKDSPLLLGGPGDAAGGPPQGAAAREGPVQGVATEKTPAQGQRPKVWQARMRTLQNLVAEVQLQQGQLRLPQHVATVRSVQSPATQAPGQTKVVRRVTRQLPAASSDQTAAPAAQATRRSESFPPAGDQRPGK